MPPHGLSLLGGRRSQRPLKAMPSTLGVRPLPAAARRTGYALLSLPLAAVYLALFTALIASVITIGVGVGVLLLPAVLAAARGFGGLERWQARALLGVHIDSGPRLRRDPGSLASRLWRLVASAGTWRVVAWLAARVLLGVGVLAAAVLGLGLAVFLVFDLGWPVIVLLVLLPLIALGLMKALDLQARIATGTAPRLLGSDPEEELATLRRSSQRLAGRNRLARDLHDTIGHALTASLLQARAAQRTLAPHSADLDAPMDGAFARQALEHIEANTNTALAELDRALALLRDESTTSQSGPGRVQPPGLDRLEALVNGVRDGGLPVELTLDPTALQVTGEISEVGYRVVQEGLTNVLKHAGCTQTTVRVTRGGHQLTVQVCNAGTAHTGPRRVAVGGRGLAGLRARLSTLGGNLSTHPTPDGGFQLTARLPLLCPP